MMKNLVQRMLIPILMEWGGFKLNIQIMDISSKNFGEGFGKAIRKALFNQIEDGVLSKLMPSHHGELFEENRICSK